MDVKQRLLRCAADIVLGQAVDRLIQQTKDDLAQATEEAVEYDEASPSNEATRACRTISNSLAPHLALAPQLRWAVFAEDDGGVSLVAQSLISDRRLSCIISREGSVSVLAIDEKMSTKRESVDLADRDAWRRWANWVNAVS